MKKKVNEPEEFIIEDIKFKKIISWKEVKVQISAIAGFINDAFKGKQPLFIITMKGGMFYGMELLKRIKIPCTFDTIFAKSYGSKMQSIPEEVSITHDHLELSDKDIIIVEDIVDTGRTLDKLLSVVKSYNPKSVTVTALTVRPKNFRVSVGINYFGFSLPPGFVIGCGMDFKESGRNLKGIYIQSDC